MFEGLEMFVTESMEYVLKELQDQGVDYEINEDKGIINVKGEITLKNPIIEVDEVTLPEGLFEGFED